MMNNLVGWLIEMVMLYIGKKPREGKRGRRFNAKT